MSEATTHRARTETNDARPPTGDDRRAQLLSSMPVEERRLDLAGIPTAVLEGGEGPPLILLHGPGEYAAKWCPVLPQLVLFHRVIAPDLPGHGASIVPGGGISADQVLDWLGALIDATCPRPPVLVAQLLGGAIAAHFAADHSERLGRLVLVDTFGLAPFQPAPEFGRALHAFLADPNADTHDGLWQYCAFNLDSLRDRMGENWRRIKAYNLDRAATTALHATQQCLMEQFALPAIPSAELDRIAVPTTLVWGRHDLATPLSVAVAASERYGWPLHVIEYAADDPPLEQPEAFLSALGAAIEN